VSNSEEFEDRGLNLADIFGGLWGLEQPELKRAFVHSLQMSEPMDQGMPEGEPGPQPSGSGGTVPVKGTVSLLETTNKYFQVKEAAVTFWVLGDSHLRRKSGFPDAYEKAKKTGLISSQFGALKRKKEWEADGKGFDQGFRLTGAYYGQVLNLIDENRGRASAYFLSIGSNDLRQEADVVERGKVVDDLMMRFRALMAKVMETPGAALFILEPVPCNRGVQMHRDQLHQRLADEVNRHDKVKYVVLTDGHGPLVKGADGSYHQSAYWKDNLHLNHQGIDLVVKALARAMGEISGDVFLVDKQARAPKPKQGGNSPAPPVPGKPDAGGPEGFRGTKAGKVAKAKGEPKAKGSSAKRTGIFSRLGKQIQEKGQPSKGSASQESNPPIAKTSPGIQYYQDRRTAAMALYQETINRINAAELVGARLSDDDGDDEDEVVELPPPPTPTCKPFRGGRGGRGGQGGSWDESSFVLVHKSVLFPRQ